MHAFSGLQCQLCGKIQAAASSCSGIKKCTNPCSTIPRQQGKFKKNLLLIIFEDKCYFNSRPMLFAFVALGNLIYWNIHAVFERKSSVTVFIYNFFLPLRPYSLVIEHLRSCLFKTVETQKITLPFFAAFFFQHNHGFRVSRHLRELKE